MSTLCSKSSVWKKQAVWKNITSLKKITFCTHFLGLPSEKQTLGETSLCQNNFVSEPFCVRIVLCQNVLWQNHFVSEPFCVRFILCQNNFVSEPFCVRIVHFWQILPLFLHHQNTPDIKSEVWDSWPLRAPRRSPKVLGGLLQGLEAS